VPSTIPGTGGQVAPGAETTGNAQIVNALGAPFVLEGLFGEADAAAMDAEPEPEGSFTSVGMDVEDEIAADGSMVIDEDPYVPSPALDIEMGKKVDRTDARYDGDPMID
jgi:nuclear GTP-binding protein